MGTNDEVERVIAKPPLTVTLFALATTKDRSLPAPPPMKPELASWAFVAEKQRSRYRHCQQGGNRLLKSRDGYENSVVSCTTFEVGTTELIDITSSTCTRVEGAKDVVPDHLGRKTVKVESWSPRKIESLP